MAGLVESLFSPAKGASQTLRSDAHFAQRGIECGSPRQKERPVERPQDAVIIVAPRRPHHRHVVGNALNPVEVGAFQAVNDDGICLGKFGRHLIRVQGVVPFMGLALQGGVGFNPPPVCSAYVLVQQGMQGTHRGVVEGQMDDAQVSPRHEARCR